MLGSFRERRREPEIMDRPDLEDDRHVQALRGLERINRWSGSARILWPGIKEAARKVGSRPLRWLDVATGGGDVPLRIWHKARRAGLNLEMEACDKSLCALGHARIRAQEFQVPIRFFECDVLHDPLPRDFDVLTCSLFLHHLSEEEAVLLMKAMARAARAGIMINDLRRCRAGWWLAFLGTRLLSTSPVVHYDGPVSVAAAFTCAEVMQLAQMAGLTGTTISKRWPFRYLLSWWKEDL